MQVELYVDRRSLCNQYGDVVENTLHVLRYCPLVVRIWLNTVSISQRESFFEAYNLQHWIDLNLDMELNMEKQVES